MGKISIDIVILPPEEIMERAIGINHQLSNDPIILNKENCLPHISLCMGVLEEGNLGKVKEIVEEIAGEFSKLKLKITSIGRKNTSFEIKNIDDLQKLHESLMTQLEPYLSYDAKIDTCLSPPPVVEKTLTWINNYKNTSFEKFHPHITLGISKIDDKELDIEFTAAKLAVCHLGNYCTCRKILFSTELS